MRPMNFPHRREARQREAIARADARSGAPAPGQQLSLKESVKHGHLKGSEAALLARGFWQCSVSSTRTGRWLLRRSHGGIKK